MYFSSISFTQWLTCLFVLSIYLLVNGHVIQNSSCETVDCGAGRECYVTQEPCNQPPCQKASCRPSCAVIRCQGDKVCKDGKCIDRCNSTSCKDDSYCQAGICVKFRTCDTTICESGDICVMQSVQCFTTPCPPLPVCIDRCAVVRCSSGFTCLKGTCRPNNVTCDTIKCPQDHVCVDSKCIPEPTCSGFKCEPGYDCYLRNQTCDQVPCLPPTPECKPSCALILCAAPSTCKDGACITF